MSLGSVSCVCMSVPEYAQRMACVCLFVLYVHIYMNLCLECAPMYTTCVLFVPQVYTPARVLLYALMWKERLEVGEKGEELLEVI